MKTALKIACAAGIAYLGDGPIRVESDGASEDLNIENPAHIQQPLITTIVDTLLGRGTCPSTGETAARTSWVMDQVLR